MKDKNEKSTSHNNITNNDKSRTIEQPKKDSLINNNILTKTNRKSLKGTKKRKSILKRNLFEKPDFIEQVLNKEVINEFDFLKSNEEIYNILKVLTQKYIRRIKKEKELIFSFLTKIKMQEVIKSDLLESNYTWNELYSYIEPYIFGKVYNFCDTLFYSGDESDLLYVIINGKRSYLI